MFGRKLDEHYGAGHAEKMYRLSKRTHQFTKDEYETYIEYYRAKVATILARRADADSSQRGGVPKKLAGGIRVD